MHQYRHAWQAVHQNTGSKAIQRKSISDENSKCTTLIQFFFCFFDCRFLSETRIVALTKVEGLQAFPNPRNWLNN